MRVVKDQMGFSIAIPATINRIVCLVPSITELLCDLGLEDKIVGITKFCIHPETCFKSKVRIGGTKDFDVEAIRLLNPDIIIANKEENQKDLLIILKKYFPVWISDVETTEQAIDMIELLGEVFKRQIEAKDLVKKINFNFDKIEPLEKEIFVAYFIWKKPYMSINGNTYINNMLQRCGLKNVFSASPSRYPKITPELLQKAKPDVIFLSSEPYPFKEKHFAELQEICPNARIFLVNGEMFSWYGSRMLKAPVYLNKLIHKLNSAPVTPKVNEQPMNIAPGNVA
jgi:ABC-type Fe3+-hydroxamate transport system substrate-binding protein